VALNIKSQDTDRLARELAALTGESITEAVTKAIEERLRHERGRSDAERERRRAKLMEIADRIARYPVLDDRSPDEILGYNEFGTFD
jgi:antitoxin VapB